MAKRSQLPKASSGTQSGQSSSRSSAGSSRWVLLGVIAAVAVLASGLILVAVQATKKPIEATDRIGDGMAWGPAGAPVTIIDFSDFGCSHCGTFALNQGERLRAEYEQTGKVRFEFKPFVLNWDTTAAPANAAACAAEQGKFWDYHDALFVRQGSSSQAFAPASLKAYAAELGLDVTNFNRCVDKKEQYGLLQDTGAEARARGVNATPTFFVNGKKIEGAAAYEVFQAAIDQALAAAQ